MLSRILSEVVFGENFPGEPASNFWMKKTAGELIETIPVEEKYEGAEIRVMAWCPVCQKRFSPGVPGTAAEMRTMVVNTAVTHIRCFHPED